MSTDASTPEPGSDIAPGGGADLSHFLGRLGRQLHEPGHHHLLHLHATVDEARALQSLLAEHVTQPAEDGGTVADAAGSGSSSASSSGSTTAGTGTTGAGPATASTGTAAAESDPAPASNPDDGVVS